VKIGDALVKVQHLYIETAPLIYFVEANPDYVDRMDAVFAAVIKQSIDVTTSVITLTEVLSHPMKQGDTKLVQEYQNILLHSKEVSVAQVTASMAETAADLRSRYNLRTPDALHVATAIKSRCE